MRILLADDHPIVRRHVRNMLNAQKDWEVCGEAATGREAVTMTGREHPDLVVLDLSMPDLNGMEAAKLIHEQFPDTEIIVLSMHEPDEVMHQLEGFGVRACIPKTNLEDLVSAIRGMKQFSRATKIRPGGKAYVA